ncbi:MAG: PilZ domain-containing protein [Nitrospira sp.]|nr:PilZ domain-containing protein [Nitrospira sp.]
MSQPTGPSKRIIDLRKHQRIVTPSSALFSFRQLIVPAQLLDDVEGEGALIDLSLGGCRLLSDTPLALGQEYHLILQISVERPPIPVEAAVVRWTEDNTYGLKFTSIDTHDESLLRDLLIEIRRPIS